MTLSELLKNYRDENGISQRELARRCGLSHGTISLLEMGENPQTNEKIEPDLRTYRRLADGMGISDYHELIEMQKSTSSSVMNLSGTEKSIIIAYRQANPSIQSAVCDILHVQKTPAASAI